MIQRISTLILALVIAAVGVTAPVAAQSTEGFYREAVLSNAAVVTADAQSTAAPGWSDADLAAFELTCVENSGTASLDVAIQRSLNGGTTWADLTTFTQLTATGGQTVLYADVRAASAQMIGDLLRVDYDVTGTGQYTCTVYAAAEG